MANNPDNNICSTLSLLFPDGIKNEPGTSKATTNYFDLDELFPQSSQELSPQMTNSDTSLTVDHHDFEDEAHQLTDHIEANGSKGSSWLSTQPKLNAKSKSGYILFCANVRKRIMSENPECGFGQVSKIVAAEWKKLSEENKRQYEARAQYIAEERRKADLFTPTSKILQPGQIRVYSCRWQLCDFQFDSQDGLYEHIKSHIASQIAVGVNRHVCLWTGCLKYRKESQPFPSLPRLLRHIKEKHLPPSAKTILPNQKRKNFFIYLPFQPGQSGGKEQSGLFVHQPYGVPSVNAIGCPIATPLPTTSSPQILPAGQAHHHPLASTMANGYPSSSTHYVLQHAQAYGTGPTQQHPQYLYVYAASGQHPHGTTTAMVPVSSMGQADSDDDIQLLTDENEDQCLTSNTRYTIPSRSATPKATTNYFNLDELFPQSSQADVDDEIQLLNDGKSERWLTSSTRYAIPSRSETGRVIESRKSATTNYHSHFVANVPGRERFNSTPRAREPRPLVQLRKYTSLLPKHSEIENEKLKRLAETRNQTDEELVQAYKAKRKEQENALFDQDPEAQARHKTNHQESQQQRVSHQKRAKISENVPTNEIRDLPGCSKSPPAIMILNETVTKSNPAASTNEPELIILEEEPPVEAIHEISRSVTEGAENLDIGHTRECTMEMDVVDEPIAKISDSITARSITEGPENEKGCEDSTDWDEITILPPNLADENVPCPASANTLRKTTSNTFSNQIESMRLNEMRKRKNDDVMVVWMGNNAEKRKKSQQERRAAIAEKVDELSRNGISLVEVFTPELYINKLPANSSVTNVPVPETLPTNTTSFRTNPVGSLPECSKSPPVIVNLDKIVSPPNNLPEIFDVEDDPSQLTSSKYPNTRRAPAILARKAQTNLKLTPLNFDEFSTPANIETNQVMETWRKQLCIEDEPVLEASEDDKKNPVE
ncbi:HMG (high mobility group) box domain-containing protein [Ditylenchus destructor]|nr:HMG (high mobility group) box domain-containing protein [Ditylenchus destructor]